MATAARGMCGTHYSRWQRGDCLDRPIRVRYAKSDVCSVGECGRHVLAKRLCSLHYQRYARSGDVQADRVPKGDPGAKWCPDCRSSLPMSSFHIGASGALAYCKACALERNRAVASRRRDKSLAYRRAYVAEHRDRIREQERVRYHKNPEKFIGLVKRRHAKKRGALLSVLTDSEWQETLEYFDHRCGYCLRRCDRLEQDHVVPLSRGGQHVQSNVVPACRTCNARKSARSVFLMAAETPSLAVQFLRG